MPETSFYVIAYDIPSDRRRTRVHKTLRGFAKWTQYSLFEAFLTDKQLVELQGRLEKHLDPNEDSVRFYPLCRDCLRHVETVGSTQPEEEKVFIV